MFVLMICSEICSGSRRVWAGLVRILQTSAPRNSRRSERFLERAVRENGAAWLVDGCGELDSVLGPGWDLGQALRDYFKPVLSEPMPPKMISILQSLDRRGLAFA